MCAFLILAVTFNCQLDEEKTVRGLHNSSEKISKNQLLSELSHPYLLSFLKSNAYKQVESDAQMRIKESKDEFQKIIFLNKYTTYTYKIPTYNPLKPSIKHLVITKDTANVEKACYILYTPSNYTFTVNLKTFSGKIETFTLENKLLSRTDYVNGKPLNENKPKNKSNKAQVCFDRTIITIVPCIGGAGHRGVGEMCHDGPSTAYYEVSTLPVCRPDGPEPAIIAAPTNFGTGGGFSSGGVAFEGIPIPALFDGEADLSNAEYKYATEVLGFTNTLTNLQSRLGEHYWLFPNILEWTKQNGELSDQNKNAIAFALEHVAPILDLEETPTRTRIEVNQLYYKAFMFLLQNTRLPAATFVSQFAQNSTANPDLKLDFDASWKSPANIDFDAIDKNTPEGARFNEVYNKLKDVPEFKALFTDIFGGSQTRLNVKFEMNEHVYNKKNEEVNATTSEPVNNNIVIKINKQCYLNNTSFTQTDLEKAKTIAHEAIHAFLFYKFKYQTSGPAIPGFADMNLKELLNAWKLVSDSDHNIMFNNLAPTLATILKKTLLKTTTQAQRTYVESLGISSSQNSPSTILTWNWDTYCTYLSYRGLEESTGFQTLFPDPSDALFIYRQYIQIGHINL